MAAALDDELELDNEDYYSLLNVRKEVPRNAIYLFPILPNVWILNGHLLIALRISIPLARQTGNDIRPVGRLNNLLLL